MKRLGFALLLLIGCEEKEVLTNEFTGNEVVYALQAGSTYAIHGTLTLKEKKDGTSFVLAEINGTSGNLQHPVHLHLGTIGTPDAAIAALLNPVVGSLGISETSLSHLADESPLSYAELIQLEACVKIHLAESGPDRDVILAAANIGAAVNTIANGRIGIATCQ